VDEGFRRPRLGGHTLGRGCDRAAIRLAKAAVNSILDEARALGPRGLTFKEEADKRFSWAMRSQQGLHHRGPGSRAHGASRLRARGRVRPRHQHAERRERNLGPEDDDASVSIGVRTCSRRSRPPVSTRPPQLRCSGSFLSESSRIPRFGHDERCLGSALTGSIEDQVITFLYGGGANGKSTLTEIVGGAWPLRGSSSVRDLHRKARQSCRRDPGSRRSRGPGLFSLLSPQKGRS
jgi:hypothetical protein